MPLRSTCKLSKRGNAEDLREEVEWLCAQIVFLFILYIARGADMPPKNAQDKLVLFNNLSDCLSADMLLGLLDFDVAMPLCFQSSAVIVCGYHN